MEESTPEQENAGNSSNRPTIWQVIMSVLAAALGVQNRKNRERDFTHGNPVVFIIAGLIFTALFVMTILSVVLDMKLSMIRMTKKYP